MTYAQRQKWRPLNITMIVLGLVVFWPLGLAMLGYILWGDDIRRAWHNMGKSTHQGSNGNAAFDDYREATLHPVEEEQAEFADYVASLRRAREKQEFDRFMAHRKAS